MKDLEAVSELQRCFGIPGIAQVLEGTGGLSMVRITSSTGTGEVYLHGAHVSSWQPPGFGEVLFVSSQSRWQDGRAIRGGVPICFPWFGDKADDPKAPAHGFVRTKAWRLDSIAQSGDSVTVSLSTGSDESTKRWWPADFRLMHRATFGSKLGLELEVQNVGTSPLRFEEALHAYHKVRDVRLVRLQGLDAVRYLDKTDGYREKVQQGEVVVRGETDRVYLDTPGALELLDPAVHRRVGIAKENSLTTVVWNPWADKAKDMSDLGNDKWTQFLCIEVANVAADAVTLAPGQQHRMKAIISTTSL